MQRTVLITGATSGIGKACSTRFAGLGDRLMITGRRNTLLKQLAADLSQSYGTEILPLVMDVRNRKQVESLFSDIPAGWKEVDILVNNAGLAAGLDFIQEGSHEDWDQMIDTNIKGILNVTRVIAPWMIKAGKGHIVNIGSIAGKEVYPKGNVYCATKFAVDALTKGMRIDMLQHGIRVSQVCPGAAETEFSEVRFKGDKQRASGVYNGFRPLSGDDVAEAIAWITGLPAHININDLVIMPAAQAGPAYLHKTI
jgi:NADP-dependent 3-hydroxy acid dehydrogenase YdfG